MKKYQYDKVSTYFKLNKKSFIIATITGVILNSLMALVPIVQGKLIDEYEKQVDKEVLSKEIEGLPDRDKEIMTLRYGLNNTKEYTQKEVAEMLGISQSYISRIEKKVVRKLKQVMIR